MHRDGASDNRSRSPSMQPDSTSSARQRDPLPRHVNDQPSAEVHSLPKFLELDSSDIKTKFDDIQWKEKMRALDSLRNPDSPFARPNIVGSKLLDRYANIHPFTSNRIQLKVPEDKSNYINASPICLQSEVTGHTSKYIAMQGPKVNSTCHTWRMVWHELESPAVIVMLTETHEGGQEKCHQYFPNSPEDEPLLVNDHDEFGDAFMATVHCVQHELTGLNDSIEVRKLVMKVDGADEEKIIWHLLYTKWPDFGVPAGEDVNAFLETMHLSRSKNASPDNPRIIHCSAGVGRSGTFIALDYLMREVDAGILESSKFKESDPERDLIFDTVCKLRTQRVYMVQAEVQYSFLYAQVKRLWEAKYLPGKAGSVPTIKVDTEDENSDIFL